MGGGASVRWRREEARAGDQARAAPEEPPSHKGGREGRGSDGWAADREAEHRGKRRAGGGGMGGSQESSNPSEPHLLPSSILMEGTSSIR